MTNKCSRVSAFVSTRSTPSNTISKVFQSCLTIMTTVTTKVDIAAPPDLVRSLFLDFPAISKWHTGHFKAITVLDSAATNVTTNPSSSVGEKLKVGDRLRISLSDGMSFKATVVENTALRFAWKGGWSHVVIGEHSFQFEPSTLTPGGTTLTHAETFTGGLVSLCRPFLKDDKAKTSPGFERFNVDIKRRAEQSK